MGYWSSLLTHLHACILDNLYIPFSTEKPECSFKWKLRFPFSKSTIVLTFSGLKPKFLITTHSVRQHVNLAYFFNCISYHTFSHWPNIHPHWFSCFPITPQGLFFFLLPTYWPLHCHYLPGKFSQLLAVRSVLHWACLHCIVLKSANTFPEISLPTRFWLGSTKERHLPEVRQ